MNINKDKFIQKYGQENSIKQVFLRKAYQNYFKLKSSTKSRESKRINKSVDPKSKDDSIKFRTDLSKGSFMETQYRSTKDNIQQISDYHYNALKNKWLNDDKSSQIYQLNLQLKQRQLEIEEQQRQQELNKIQQAILLRELFETDRKRKFYKEAEIFRNQQSERKHQEMELNKSRELQYMIQAKKMAENEQLEQLEQQIIRRQKCKLQFEMLESQRRTRSYFVS